MEEHREPARPVVLLHVGAMKTGTTYLQQLLYANEERLAEQGLTLPGDGWIRQVRGVEDVMRLARLDQHLRQQTTGAWHDLVSEALAADRSLISVEYLSFASRSAVRRVLDSLEGAEAHVVLTVRDMAAALPSQWQTLVHNNEKVSWDDYLTAIPRPGAPRLPLLPGFRRPQDHFHRTQNVPRMLTAWARDLPPGRLHVVTVPRSPADPDELWRRFAAVIGVDPAVATEPPVETNPSLGYASAELIRRVNVRLRGVKRSEYNWTVKEIVALGDLAHRAHLENRPPMTRAAYDRALAWNALTRNTIQATGATVSGDLADLPVVPDRRVRAALATRPAPPDPEAMLDAAQAAVARLMLLARRRARRLRAVGVEARPERRPGPRAARRAWETSPEPVDAAADDVAARSQEAALLLRRIRQERRRGVVV